MNRIEHAPRLTWSDVALGGWIRVGLAGAFATLASPALAVAGVLSPGDALVVAGLGAGAAALAWRRVALRLGARRTTARRLRPQLQA